MNITVKNRRDIEKFVSTTPYYLISIWEPKLGAPALLEDGNRKLELHIPVDDTSNIEYAKENGLVLFDDDLAKEVVKFGMDADRCKVDVVVHCSAGISRSSAVAAALMKIFNGSDKDIFGCKKYVPNMLIYNKIIYADYEINRKI